MNKRIVLLYGPTATGKSDCATHLARTFPFEIINADMGQFYTPFSIGTAKPDWKNEPARHHLFDILDEPRDYTVVEYRKAVLSLCSEIFDRGNIPLLVGGSGFYLKSLFFPPLAQTTTPKNILRVIPETGDLSNEDAWELLASYDPVRASQIHAHDRYRIERAFTVLQTEETAHGKQPEYLPPEYPFLFICLNRKREELYNRIDTRTQLMIDGGWLDEVARLEETDWVPFLKRKKLIGYSELITYLEGSYKNKSHIIEAIAQKTRHYAKRQMTFWRMLEKELLTHIAAPSAVVTCEATSDNHAYELIENQITLFLKKTEGEKE